METSYFRDSCQVSLCSQKVQLDARHDGELGERALCGLHQPRDELGLRCSDINW